MNHFLNQLFEKIGIDVDHLRSYLSSMEIDYLDNTIKSKNDFAGNFHTNEHGDNLEVLLHFLSNHKNDINIILNDPSRKEVLIDLYTSSCISGEYDCFRFDLSKLDKTYKSKNIFLKLYRIGREGEVAESSGNSWSASTLGLKSYYLSSSIDVSNRPVFMIEVNDSEVLFKGKDMEEELVLRPGFDYVNIEVLNDKKKSETFD